MKHIILSDYVEAVTETINDLPQKNIMVGPSCVCVECTEAFGTTEQDDMIDEGSFSYRSCDCCNSELGGKRYAAHAFDDLGDIVHFDVCEDCVQYLADGELPDLPEGKRRAVVSFFDLSEEWQAEAISNLDELAEEAQYLEPEDGDEPGKHILWDLSECMRSDSSDMDGVMAISNNSALAVKLEDDGETAVTWILETAVTWFL